jgi:hypothetical protein
MTRTIAHTDIVQEVDRALELEEHLQHRVNMAGVQKMGFGILLYPIPMHRPRIVRKTFR